MTAASALRKCNLLVHPCVWRGEMTEVQSEDLISYQEVFGLLISSKGKFSIKKEDYEPDFHRALLRLVGPFGWDDGCIPNQGERREKSQQALRDCRRFEAFIDKDADGTMTMRVQYFVKGSKPFHEDVYDRRKKAKPAPH